MWKFALDWSKNHSSIFKKTFFKIKFPSFWELHLWLKGHNWASWKMEVVVKFQCLVWGKEKAFFSFARSNLKKGFKEVVPQQLWNYRWAIGVPQ